MLVLLTLSILAADTNITSPQAASDGAQAMDSGSTFSVANAVVERVLAVEIGKPLRTVRVVNRLTDETLAVDGNEFRLVVNGQSVSSDSLMVTEVDESTTAQERVVTVTLEGAGLNIRATYRAPVGGGPLSKELEIENSGEGEVVLDEVWLEDLPLAQTQPVIRSNGLCPYVVFLRGAAGGLIVCIDFPVQDIEARDGRVTAGFPPHARLKPGEIFHTHRAVLSAYRLVGHSEDAVVASDVGTVEGGQLISSPQAPKAVKGEAPLDAAESEAWRDCVDELYPPHARKPFLMTFRFCEGEMNELEERWGGHEGLYWNDYLDQVRSDVSVAAKLGFDTIFFGPEPPKWHADNPSRERLTQVLAEGREQGVRLGLYTNANNGSSLGPFWRAWGIDIATSTWDIPGAELLDANGKPLIPPMTCWGSRLFTDRFTSHYLPEVERGFGNLAFDFTFLRPCYATNHGHVAGDIYQQAVGLMEFMERCRRIDPEFRFFGFLGWGQLMPHASRYMDMYYVADPWMDFAIPGLNQNVLFADSRRKQMRSFVVNGLPPRLLANCDFMVWQDSVAPDYTAYEYVVLQGLALTPNWTCLFPWLEELPHKEYQRAVEFIQRWNQWRTDRWEILKNITFLSPPPGIGVLESYMHTDGQRGFLFLVNPNAFGLTRDFEIGPSMGLSDAGPFYLREWYPEEQWRLVNDAPVGRVGEKVRFDVPAFSVQVVEFVSAAIQDDPGVWGVPVRDRVSSGFTFERRTSVARRIGVRPANGLADPGVTVDGQPVPAALRDGVLVFTDTPPPNESGERPNPELRDWTVRCDSLDDGLAKQYPAGLDGTSWRFPLPSVLQCPEPASLMDAPGTVMFEGGNVDKFLGGYLYNTRVRSLRGPSRFAEVKTVANASATQAPEVPTATLPAAPDATSLSPCREYWASTEITLPSTANTLAENAKPMSEHLYLLLAFLDYHAIERLRVWINGREAQVETMGYYRSIPGQPLTAPDPEKYNFAYYVDGTKWGLQDFQKNTVVLHVAWKTPGQP